MSDEELSGEEMIARDLAALNADEPDEVVNDPDEVDEVDEVVDDQYEEDEEDEEEKPKKKIYGYISEDDWVAAGNDPEDYLTAEQYQKVGKMRDDNTITKHALAKNQVLLEKTLNEVLANQNKMLQESNDRVRQEERAKLEAAKAEALEYGNAEDAVKIHDKIRDLEKPVEQPQQAPVPESVERFFNNNKDWYGAAKAPTEFLDYQLQRNQDMLNDARAKGIPFDEAIKPLVEKTREAFPMYFDAPKKPKPRPKQMSERSSVAPKARGKTYSIKDLDPEMRGYARSMIKRVNANESDYVKELLGE